MWIRPFPKLECIAAIVIPFRDFSNLMTCNIYAVGRDPITLIDAGPKLSGSIEFLREQLRLAGLNINHIERILITHGHDDHFGLASRIRDAVDHPVECFIHYEESWRISRENFEKRLWRDGFEELRVLVDMPQKEMERIIERIAFFRTISEPVEGVSIMEDGDEFTGEGYHLKVIHTPGHSSGMCCLYESKERVLFSGDHVIKHITPNPIMETRRRNLRDPNYKSLKAYTESLDKIAKLDIRYCFPGHGEFIEDLDSILNGYRSHHKQRMDLIWHVLKKKSVPLYSMVKDIFPNMPEDDLFLALSEIIVHLDVIRNPHPMGGVQGTGYAGPGWVWPEAARCFRPL